MSTDQSFCTQCVLHDQVVNIKFVPGSAGDSRHVQGQQTLHPRREAAPGQARQGGEGGGRARGEARGLLPQIRPRQERGELTRTS